MKAHGWMIIYSFDKISWHWIVMLACVLCLWGCRPADDKIDQPDTWLLRSGSFIISPEGFNEELELKKAAYSYDIQDDPYIYNEMVIDLVSSLSDDLRFFQLASDKQIQVTAQEVDLAESEFKKDYPEDSFNQLLLENAISYSLWKKRFRRDLLIDKVIQQELVEKIEISPDDIYKFYQQEQVGKVNEKQLIERLRRDKSQHQYDGWIQQLMEIYPVDINTDLLKTVLKE